MLYLQKEPSMSQIAFNTLSYVKKLAAAGVTQEIAEAHAEA